MKTKFPPSPDVLIALFFYALWLLGAWTSMGQTNWHDPALDGLNVNLGYLNSDLNGQMENLPHRISETNMDRTIIRMQGLTSNVLSSQGLSWPSNSDHAKRHMLSNAVAGSFTNFSGLSPGRGLSNSMDGLGPSSAWLIPLARYSSGQQDYATLDISITTGNYISPSFCSFIRNLLIVIEMAMFVWLIADELKKSMSETLNQRQVEGSKFSVGGTNSSVVSALGYAVAFTALIAGAVTAVFNYSWVNGPLSASVGAGASSSFSSLLGSLDALAAAYPAWAVFTSLIPVESTVIIFASYLAFKYLFLGPLFLGVRALFFWFSS